MVQFGVVRKSNAPALHTRGALRRTSVLLIALGAPLVAAGGCAHNVAEAPGLQWQFSDAEQEAPAATFATVDRSPLPPVEAAEPANETASDPSAQPAPSAKCGSPRGSGWADNCYVYRGGRDPKTGRAYTQL